MQFQNIVFPVDFSERTRAVAPFVQSLARRSGATLTLLHVIPPPPVYFDLGAVYPDVSISGSDTEAAEARLREIAKDEFPHVNVRCAVVNGDPAHSIISFAQEANADLIALPTHGYGLFQRFLLGSVTAKVLKDSTIPVWTSAHALDASHRAHPQPRTIIAAIDLKEASCSSDRRSQRTLQTALALAWEAGAAVEILHIAPEGTTSSIASELRVERAVAQAVGAGSVPVERAPATETQITQQGESIGQVVRRVALLKRADLLVIGRGGIHGNLLDRLHSHDYEVICESPCPVLSV